MRQPCNNCPWRKDAPREHWDPAHFKDIYDNCQSDGVNVMLCHKASELPAAERASLVCQGWVRVLGRESVGVRIALMSGRASLEEVEDKSGPELFESFDLMMLANKVRPRFHERLCAVLGIDRVGRESPTMARGPAYTLSREIHTFEKNGGVLTSREEKLWERLTARLENE